MTYYEAKFERERKGNPTRWAIVPDGAPGSVMLVYIGVPRYAPSR